MSEEVTESNESQTSSLKKLTQVLYGLHALTAIGIPTNLIAIIINYVKRRSVRGSWLESHFRWQIITFWVVFIGQIIVVNLPHLMKTVPGRWVGNSILFVGGKAGVYILMYPKEVLGLMLGSWLIYRVVKGWLYLQDNKTII